MGVHEDVALLNAFSGRDDVSQELIDNIHNKCFNDNNYGKLRRDDYGAFQQIADVIDRKLEEYQRNYPQEVKSVQVSQRYKKGTSLLIDMDKELNQIAHSDLKLAEKQFNLSYDKVDKDIGDLAGINVMLAFAMRYCNQKSNQEEKVAAVKEVSEFISNLRSENGMRYNIRKFCIDALCKNKISFEIEKSSKVSYTDHQLNSWKTVNGGRDDINVNSI